MCKSSDAHQYGFLASLGGGKSDDVATWTVFPHNGWAAEIGCLDGTYALQFVGQQSPSYPIPAWPVRHWAAIPTVI